TAREEAREQAVGPAVARRPLDRAAKALLGLVQPAGRFEQRCVAAQGRPVIGIALEGLAVRLLGGRSVALLLGRVAAVADRVDHARARRGEGLLGPLALGPFEEGLVLAEERRVGRLELHRAAVVDGGARA